MRLWTEREHGQRPAHELPEVKRLDLAEVVLTLKAAGIDDVAAFPWLEKPDPKALDRAETLLADLGAIAPTEVGARGSITEIGRKMLRFPVHPRYARMFLAAQERGCVRPVALMAALTQGRNFLLRGVPREVEQAREERLGEENESDFFLLMRAWRHADQAGFGIDACRRLGVHAQGARQVGPLFAQFLEIARGEGLDIAERRVDGAEVRKCVLAGFSDQLARRLDAGTLRCELVHKRRGLLARESADPAFAPVRGRRDHGDRGPRRDQHAAVARHGGRGEVAARAFSRRLARGLGRDLRPRDPARGHAARTPFPRPGAGIQIRQRRRPARRGRRAPRPKR